MATAGLIPRNVPTARAVSTQPFETRRLALCLKPVSPKEFIATRQEKSCQTGFSIPDCPARTPLRIFTSQKRGCLPVAEFGTFLGYDGSRKELKIAPRVLTNRKDMNSERYPIELDRNGDVLINGYLLKTVPPPMGGRDDETLGRAEARDENPGLIRRGRPGYQKPKEKKGG